MEESKDIKPVEFDFVKAPFFTESEEILLKNNLKADKIPLKTNLHKYEINLKFLMHFPVSKQNIFFLHGHGDSPSWRSWIKLALKFFELNYNCYLIDLPGFGISLVDDVEGVSFLTWQEDGADMFKLLLDELKIKKIHVIARCGGAALTIRMLSKYPEVFEKSHIFHNNMISAVPENFIPNLSKKSIKIFSSWNADPDHPKLSVGYKWYNMHRKKKSDFLFFLDIEEKDLTTYSYKNQNYKAGKRRLKNYQIMDFSQKYLDFVIYFITNDKFKEEF